MCIRDRYNSSYNELLLSFANNVNTPDGGTHEEGFKNSLTRVFNDYGRSHGRLKDKDENLSGADVREGLILSLIHILPHRARPSRSGGGSICPCSHRWPAPTMPSFPTGQSAWRCGMPPSLSRAGFPHF